MYNELESAKKLASDLEVSREDSRRKSFFLNAVSHDLRTPLNALVLQSEVASLCLSKGDMPAVQEAVRTIAAEARASADLLTRFLELGRLDWNQDVVRPQETDCMALANVIERAQGEAHVKGLSFEADFDGSTRIRVDTVKMVRVLDNLIGNAIKFTTTGGIRLTAETDGGDLKIHVQDTGVGIDPQRMDLLFEEFYQVQNDERNRAKGFGLGLAISQRLVNQLGGRIEVRSQPSRGSCFTVILPGAVINSRYTAQRDGAAPRAPAAASVGG